MAAVAMGFPIVQLQTSANGVGWVFFPKNLGLVLKR